MDRNIRIFLKFGHCAQNGSPFAYFSSDCRETQTFLVVFFTLNPKMKRKLDIFGSRGAKNAFKVKKRRSWIK